MTREVNLGAPKRCGDSSRSIVRSADSPKIHCSFTQLLADCPTVAKHGRFAFVMTLQTLILIANVSLVLIVLGFGLKARTQDATYFFRRPGELVRALLAMGVLLPLFAVALVLIFDLHPAVKIALVVLSISPMPPRFPKTIMGAGGSGSYAIGLLAVAGVAAVVFVPAAMVILGQVFNLPLQMSVVSMSAVVFLTTLLPLGLGIAVNYHAPGLGARSSKPISLIGEIGLWASVVGIVVLLAPAVWTLIGNGTVIAVAIFVLFGVAIGHLIGGPQPENRVALALSTGGRNAGIALAIAQVNFPQVKLAAAAVLLYLLVKPFIMIPYTLWMKRESPVVANQVKA